MASHDAAQIRHALADRSSCLTGRFPFPKSLYAVEDTLRFFVADKPDATIVDFFAGSGTTAHAVMRLNKQDGGRRVSISVTNNEVSADEQRGLRKKRLRPGDADWEQWGICEYITKPRIEAAITGKTPTASRSRATTSSPTSSRWPTGSRRTSSSSRSPTKRRCASRRTASSRRSRRSCGCGPGRAGGGSTTLRNGWDVADAYGVLADLDRSDDVPRGDRRARPTSRIAFIVTDEDRLFEASSATCPTTSSRCGCTRRTCATSRSRGEVAR